MRNVLLLQGPVGPFFKVLSKYLRSKKNVNVQQITFNGGDHHFSDKNASVAYDGHPDDWSTYLNTYVENEKITDIIVFGDCRYYHREAKKIADKLSISFWAFEEGYLRPSFITLEKNGVNGNSLFDFDQLQAEIEKEKNKNNTPIKKADMLVLKRSFLYMGWHASKYYFFKLMYKNRYKHYIHHRPWHVLEETFNWVKSGIRKFKYSSQELNLKTSFEEELSGKYFFAPLQVSVDSQILYHSSYRSIEEFIGDVIKSFAENADKGDYLVFKHHPMDRGFNHYAGYIKKLSYAYDVNGRVLYVHDLHVPTLLKHAKGTITVNSTVGLSSLYHNVPTITLGRAVYNIDGITCQQSLNDFWTSCSKPCQVKFKKFRETLLTTNQISGSFYQKQEITLQAVADKFLM
jgi:capsular polysaccharide export protein